MTGSISISLVVWPVQWGVRRAILQFFHAKYQLPYSTCFTVQRSQGDVGQSNETTLTSRTTLTLTKVCLFLELTRVVWVSGLRYLPDWNVYNTVRSERTRDKYIFPDFLDILSLTDSRVLKVTYSKLGTWRLNKRISIYLA